MSKWLQMTDNERLVKLNRFIDKKMPEMVEEMEEEAPQLILIKLT